MNTYTTADRAAAMAASKQQVRDLIATLNAYRPGRIAAMPMWVDGEYGDYWYVELDGAEIGDIRYDSFGPVIGGDALGTLVYRASRAAELAAERNA